MVKSSELKVALKAAETAGKIALEQWGNEIETELKEDKSRVTKADKECERTIIEIITKEFPDAFFLGEESGESGKKGNEKWIVDPIDGTTNFSRGLPFFGNMIGLEKNGEIVLGVSSLPFFRKTFFAEKEKGAFLNGERIFVSKKDSLEESMIFLSSWTGKRRFLSREKNRLVFSELTNSVVDVESTGSMLDASFVFEGKAEASVCLWGKPWDFAASKIIVEEAGGIFTDLNRKETIYSGSAVIANKPVHRKIMEIFGKHEKYL